MGLVKRVCRELILYLISYIKIEMAVKVEIKTENVIMPVIDK